MGELDEKAFFNACKERYGAEAETKALEFCSLWQDNLGMLTGILSRWWPQVIHSRYALLFCNCC
jgi:hypothetical protein